MQLSEVKEYFNVKTNVEVAKILNKSKGLMTIWQRQGIPKEAQAVIQVMTKNQLKADIAPYNKTPQA